MQQTIGLDELIASHPFLMGLEPRLLPVLQDCASPRRFSSHQCIFQELGGIGAGAEDKGTELGAALHQHISVFFTEFEWTAVW